MPYDSKPVNDLTMNFESKNNSESLFRKRYTQGETDMEMMMDKTLGAKSTIDPRHSSAYFNNLNSTASSLNSNLSKFRDSHAHLSKILMFRVNAKSGHLKMVERNPRVPS